MRAGAIAAARGLNGRKLLSVQATAKLEGSFDAIKVPNLPNQSDELVIQTIANWNH
ncbi:hypothetical protein [Mesorhizobium sp. B1-1-8]|uniref:hypothetical protein n=1 Tax=Mesorhizobium sp. B1-1-8 TaxID=2589976 RepID=UPI0015E28A58|nr:hypothetical protein [Mesorhizobium sp. B1-1-8]UCI06536.1 hypothetical protein FJ974_22380 [Mesorhizobium sp. B1-1-8]